MISRLRMSLPPVLVQQPFAEPVPVTPETTPVLVDPAAKPVRPEVPAAKLDVPVTVEPAHSVVRLLGGAIPIIGLTPALPISVEPSGIAPPLSVDALLVEGFDSGEAVPVEPV